MKLSIALAYAYAIKVTAFPIMGKGEEDKHDHDERGRGLKSKTHKDKDVGGGGHIFVGGHLSPSAMEKACREICAKFPGYYYYYYAKTDGIDYVFIPSGAVKKGTASLEVFKVTNSSNPCVYTAELSWSLVDGGSTESGTITYGGNSFGCTGALQLHSEEPNSSFIAVHLLPKSGNIEVMMSGALSAGGPVTSIVTGPYELQRDLDYDLSYAFAYGSGNGE
jgi:hypothetical protein